MALHGKNDFEAAKINIRALPIIFRKCRPCSLPPFIPLPLLPLNFYLPLPSCPISPLSPSPLIVTHSVFLPPHCNICIPSVDLGRVRSYPGNLSQLYQRCCEVKMMTSLKKLREIYKLETGKKNGLNNAYQQHRVVVIRSRLNRSDDTRPFPALGFR